ncbi:hypothetical protein C8F04DRAFT_1188875 [Mycena alexandri]|uniref:Uncharacterized protein n=1 Tax=Mycena alexandri TaxID=1745969 RepID=A0AAD6WUW5_9AGAR|nr:hypothetical protein C8F04DRAFT_1188875 [Mycena alexandri]
MYDVGSLRPAENTKRLNYTKINMTTVYSAASERGSQRATRKETTTKTKDKVWLVTELQYLTGQNQYADGAMIKNAQGRIGGGEAKKAILKTRDMIGPGTGKGRPKSARAAEWNVKDVGGTKEKGATVETNNPREHVGESGETAAHYSEQRTDVGTTRP